MNVEDLSAYTCLSKSKIYILTQLKPITMVNKQHIRQKFFAKDLIDAWLLGAPNLPDDFLERKFENRLQDNK